MKRLSHKEKELINLGRAILKFSRKNIKHKITSDGGGDYLKNALFFLNIFFEEQLDGVLRLCSESMTKQAISLMRNEFEASLYASYISLRNSEKRLALFAIFGISLQLKGLNAFNVFVNKYPGRAGRDALTDKESLRREIEAKNVMIAAIRKNYKLREKEKMPSSLEAIAIECDKVGPKRFRKGDTEYYYNLFYRYFSTYVHPSPLAMDRASEAANLNPMTLATSIDMYLTFLKLLKKKKRFLVGQDVSKFTKTLKRIVSQGHIGNLTQSSD